MNGEPEALDCERKGYPCDLGETSAELRQRIAALLDEGLTRLREGSIADARAFLASQPDVLDVLSSDRAVTFRVKSGPPAWLVDHSGIGGESGPQVTRVTSPPSREMPPIRLVSVVGDDTSTDGRIDQRDAKRALVLAPYHWQFAPNDESDYLAERLETMTGYEGGVVEHANRERSDENVTLEDYRSFDEFDAIFISTHGTRACPSAESTAGCETVVSTGVYIDLLDYAITGGPARGMIPIKVWDEETERRQSIIGGQGGAVVELGLVADFLRATYPHGLDDTLIALSACETGQVAGEALAAAAAGENFVMMAWSDTVGADAASNAVLNLVEQLSYGLTSSEAYGAVIDAGLASAFVDVDERDEVEDLIVTEYERLSPGTDDVRLVELPSLMDGDGPLRDGTDITTRVAGAADDGAPDRVSLDLHLIGVEDTRNYRVRYEVDGRPAPGSYDLATANKSDLPYAYDVRHEVNIGFDLPAREFEIAVIVELPEGGESRYTVLVVAAVGIGARQAMVTIGDVEPYRFSLDGDLAQCRRQADGSIVGIGFTMYSNPTTYGQTTGATLEFTMQPDDWADPEPDLWAYDDPRIEIHDYSGNLVWKAGGGPFPSTSVTSEHSRVDAWRWDGDRVTGTAYFIEYDAAIAAEIASLPPVSHPGTFEIDCSVG